jgi:type I restriction enzyme M protein
MVFKKCRENPKDILFIDASNEFDKAKNQNVLRPQDIEKIISTYQSRKEVDKYSHIAPLSEIQENGYNLNISRYVSTFDEEELINIDEVAEQLQSFEKEMKPLDDTILKYCKELGIKSPF